MGDLQKHRQGGHAMKVSGGATGQELMARRGGSGEMIDKDIRVDEDETGAGKGVKFQKSLP